MLPAINSDLSVELTEDVEPSKNYRMVLDSERIKGTCDDLAAMRQVVFKILSTERYVYPIYSWDYGVELRSLIGQPMPYVIPEIERRIKEALEVDDRIERVDGFKFDINGKKVLCTFNVHTIFGDLQNEDVEVNV